MKLKKKNSRMSTVGLSSFFALLAVLGVAVVCPSMGTSASAANLSIDFNLAETMKAAMLQIDFYLQNSGAGVSQMSQLLTIDFFLENGDPNYPAIFKLLGIDFVLRNNMAIDLYNLNDTVQIEEEIQPTPTGQYVEGKTSFNVYTSDAQTGFAVYVGSTDTETAMVTKNEAGEVVGKINTLGTAVDGGTNFTGNTWGYNLTATNATPSNVDTTVPGYGKYRGLSADKEKAYVYNSHGDINFELAFGAKVDMSTEAGDYERGVELTAVTPATASVQLMEAYTLADKYIARTFELRPELKEEVDARKAETGKTGTFETMSQILNVMNEEKYSQE